MNTLYYGDNLNILREYIKDESVDLIYLDPPFNSNRSYNVLFKDESGLASDAQIGIFLTLEEPSKDMLSEAASAGFYHSALWQKDYPRVQIVTVEELLNGAEVKVPPTPKGFEAFKKAEKAQKKGPRQGELGI